MRLCLLVWRSCWVRVVGVLRRGLMEGVDWVLELELEGQ